MCGYVAGCDVSIKNKAGMTAAMVAADACKSEIIEFFIKQPAISKLEKVSLTILIIPAKSILNICILNLYLFILITKFIIVNHLVCFGINLLKLNKQCLSEQVNLFFAIKG